MRLSAAIALLCAVGVAVPAAIAQEAHPGPARPDGQRTIAVAQGSADVAGVTMPLAFAEPVKDLGRMSDETPVQVKFTFKNVSDKPVKITNMTGSCGCTVPQKPAKAVYEPGEAGEVVATFNPANRRGKEVKHIYVDTDYTPRVRADLAFSVETQPRVMVDPQNILMGEVHRGETRSQTITITGREPGFDVTNAKVADNSANFTLERLERTEFTDAEGAKSTRVTYRVDLAPGLPLNSYRATLAFFTTDPKRPSISAQVQCAVVGDVRVNPAFVQLLGTKAGLPWVQELRIDHRNGQPFKITSIDASAIPPSLAVVCDLQPAPGLSTANSGYVLRISGITPAVSGFLTGRFVLKTTEQATIVIPLQASIQIAPPQR